MTNIQYYGYNNIIFETNICSLLEDVYDDYVTIDVYYKTKHSKENIELASIFCKRENAKREKARWLLKKHEFIVSTAVKWIEKKDGTRYMYIMKHYGG